MGLVVDGDGHEDRVALVGGGGGAPELLRLLAQAHLRQQLPLRQQPPLLHQLLLLMLRLHLLLLQQWRQPQLQHLLHPPCQLHPCPPRLSHLFALRPPTLPCPPSLPGLPCLLQHQRCWRHQLPQLHPFLSSMQLHKLPCTPMFPYRSLPQHTRPSPRQANSKHCCKCACSFRFPLSMCHLGSRRRHSGCAFLFWYVVVSLLVCAVVDACMARHGGRAIVG